VRPPVVSEPEQLTESWLTDALGGSDGQFVVSEVVRTPVGTGQMGASYRLGLTYEGDPGDRPETVVAKLPSPDPSRRQLAAGAYRTEIGFYRDLAHTVAVPVPHCHYADISDDGAAFVLLLEDLHPARQGDQLVGATPDEAEQACRSLAALHAPRWGDPTLAELEWVLPVDEEGADLLGQILVGATEIFCRRYEGRLRPADAPLLARVAEVVGPWILGRPERFAPVHGDYRMDNLMFAPEGFSRPMPTVVDWQTVGVGLPARDLSYLLETSLDPALRRSHEHDLVAAYHDELVELGVTDYPLDLCFDDYRFGAIQGPLITVLGAAYGTETERGDEMFLAMISRSCDALRDLDTLSSVA